jgi:hypothetical protein
MAFAGLQELLGAGVIKALGNTFTAAQLGNAGLAAQTVQNNSDLLFGRMTIAVARRMFFTIRSDADSGCTDFCLISTP